MTVIMEIESTGIFISKIKDLHLSHRTFEFRERHYSTSPILILRAYDSDEDIIYKTTQGYDRKINNVDEVEVELSNEGKIAKVEYDYGFIDKISRQHKVNEDNTIVRGEDDFEAQESKKLKDKIREALKSMHFIEGEMRGSAKEVFVEVGA